MTIHRLIQNLSFNQDDIDRLAAAYEDALRALHISDRDDPINQIIAQRIIEGARTGVRNHLPVRSLSSGEGRKAEIAPMTDRLRSCYERDWSPYAKKTARSAVLSAIRSSPEQPL
jgi:hypothetical protein